MQQCRKAYASAARKGTKKEKGQSFDQRLYLTPVREDTNAKILRLKSQAYFAAAFLTAAVASVVAFLTTADASSEAFLPAAIINSTVSS